MKDDSWEATDADLAVASAGIHSIPAPKDRTRAHEMLWKVYQLELINIHYRRIELNIRRLKNK